MSRAQYSRQQASPKEAWQQKNRSNWKRLFPGQWKPDSWWSTSCSPELRTLPSPQALGPTSLPQPHANSGLLLPRSRNSFDKFNYWARYNKNNICVFLQVLGFSLIFRSLSALKNNIQHLPSSVRFVQSNQPVINFVKVVKRILKKCWKVKLGMSKLKESLKTCWDVI